MNNHKNIKMRNILIVILAIFAFSNITTAQEIKPQEVKEIMEKVADWQIENFLIDLF